MNTQLPSVKEVKKLEFNIESFDQYSNQMNTVSLVLYLSRFGNGYQDYYNYNYFNTFLIIYFKIEIDNIANGYFYVLSYRFFFSISVCFAH